VAQPGKNIRIYKLKYVQYCYSNLHIVFFTSYVILRSIIDLRLI